MPLPAGASLLYAAAAKNDQNAFFGLLNKIRDEGKMPHDMNAVVNLIIKNDQPVMITTLLKIDADIRAARAKQSALEAQEASGEIELIVQLPTDRSLSDAEETQLAAQRAKTAPYKGVDMHSALGYAGIGEKLDAPIRPQALLALIRSSQFRQAAAQGGSMASTVLSNLMMRGDDQTTRISAAVQEIERGIAQYSADAGEDAPAGFTASNLVREAMMTSFAADRGHCFNTGDAANFSKLVELLDTQDADAVLGVLAKSSGSIDQAKFSQLLDKASLAAMEAAYKIVAAAGDRDTYATLSERVGATVDIKETLLAACGGEKGAVGADRSNARSLDTLRGVLADNDSIPQDAVFAALEAAISAHKPEHLAALLDYAVGGERYPDIAKQETSDHSTLLIKALMLGMGKTKAANPADNRMIGRMADMLMDVGVSIASDTHGNDPISLLAERGMKDSGAYRKIARVADNQVDMGFAQQRAKLEALGALSAKLEAAKMIQGALNSGVSIAALSAAGIDVDPKLLALGTGVPATPSLPALDGPKVLGKHTGNEQKRQAGGDPSPAD